jgi:hypothetical protein
MSARDVIGRAAAFAERFIVNGLASPECARFFRIGRILARHTPKAKATFGAPDYQMPRVTPFQTQVHTGG